MKIDKSKKLKFIIYLNPFLLLILAGLFFVQFYHTHVEIEKQNSYIEFENNLRNVQLALDDAETAVRGYAISNDTSFLRPYAEARQSLRETGLTRQIYSNEVPSQFHDEAIVIDSLSRAKMDFCKELIFIQKHLGKDSSQAFVTSRLGENVMENARNRINFVTNNIDTYIQSNSQGIRTYYLVYGMLILFVLVDFVSSFFTQKYISAQNTRLKKLNFKLSRINARLVTQSVELQRSNDDLRQFAYIASHDLKEPLRNIAGFIQLVKKHSDNDLNEKSSEYIDLALQHTYQLSDLIDDLLSYSQLGKNMLHLEDVDVNIVMQLVTQNLNRVIRERNAHIVYDNLPTVTFHYSLLMQVLNNLVENAIKFNHSDMPEIKVVAKEMETEWLISVSDNGIGIDSKYTDDIFVMFKRLHTRHEYDGNGIGLAVCKRILEHYDGKIWFEQTASGTTFYFTIKKQSAGSIKKEIPSEVITALAE